MPKILHSLLPKSLHFWLPFTSVPTRLALVNRGTFDSATGGTFHSDIPGTFETDMGGTFKVLQSKYTWFMSNPDHCRPVNPLNPCVIKNGKKNKKKKKLRD